MINAPQLVIDALASGNFKYADLVSINLGDAYDTGFDVILYYTNYQSSISFGGNTYTPNHNVNELAGISRKASTGSDKVDIVFDITDESVIDAIRSERYINKPTSIKRVIMQDGAVLADFAIPIRTAWGLSHESSGDEDSRSITLTIDSSLGDLKGDNGWYAINSSHQRRYPSDLIMNHSSTVMTEDQQLKYTTNFRGSINQQIKPPALPKIYGYKNVEAVPIAMLKHRKTHTSYRHYFTTLIYVLNIGDCDNVDIANIKKGGEKFDVTIVTDTERDIGGWSCRVRTPLDATNGNLLSEETNGDLSFWFEGMDSQEKARMAGMYGKGLTLLFLKNRNRDDWLSQAPKITVPVRGAKVYDPRTSTTVFSRNPALQYADFLRSTQYGAGQRGITLSDTNIGELADHFEQIPDSLGNAGINSILIDVQLDTGSPIVDNMNIWMEGVRLFTSDYYGEFNVRVETKSPVVLSVDEDDLEGYPDYNSGEFTDKLNQLTYSVKQLVQDTTFDSLPTDLVEVDVEATFPEDGTLIHTGWITEDDGIDNFDSVALDYVTDLEQAYYWAMVDARISRQPRELELPMGTVAWLLEVGDVIQYSSKILNMTNVLWRVDEVSEDDGASSVKLIAYDDNFYTPDPDAIPEPVAFARPPTDIALSGVSGLAVTSSNGFYYIDWEPVSSANVSWYALEVLKAQEPVVDGEAIILEPYIDEPRVFQPPFKLPEIIVGTYRVNIITMGYQDEGGRSLLDFVVALPEVPTINTTIGNFSVEVYPTVVTPSLGNTFRLLFNNVDDFDTAQDKGTSGSFTLASLLPNTNYYLWVRTENAVGESLWATEAFTTANDATALGEFLNVLSLRLNTDSQVFAFDNGTPVVITPSAINLTATASNINTTIDPLVWSTVPAVTLSGTGNSRTLTSGDFGANQSVAVTVATTSGSFSDTVTIVKLEGGGVNGEDAINGFLTNESHNIAAASDGTITGNLAAAGGAFEVYKGTLSVTGNSTFTTESPVNMTATIDALGVYTINTLTADEGTITFKATHLGVDIRKTYSITKAKAGSTGLRGSTEISRDISGVAPPNNTQWSDAQANLALTSIGLTPSRLDRVNLYNEAEGFTETRFLDSDDTTWLPVVKIYDGNLLVNGTVGASKIITDELFAQNINITGQMRAGGVSNYATMGGASFFSAYVANEVVFSVSPNSGKIYGNYLTPASVQLSALGQDVRDFIQSSVEAGGGTALSSGGFVSKNAGATNQVISITAATHKSGNPTTLELLFTGSGDYSSEPSTPSVSVQFFRGQTSLGVAQVITGTKQKFTEDTSPPTDTWSTILEVDVSKVDDPADGDYTYNVEITSLTGILYGTFTFSADEALVGGGGVAVQTPAQLLADIKTVDGAGSGLDADTVDGFHASASALASTAVVRDASRDITTRLIRTDFGDDNYLTGAIGFRINNGGSNHNRYCNSPPAARGWLVAPSRTGADASGTWPIAITGNAASANYATNAGLLDNKAGSDGAGINTVALRDSSGDLIARTTKSTLADTGTISGAIAFRINNSNDSFTRYCNSTPAVRAWMGVPSITGADASGTWPISVTGNAAYAPNAGNAATSDYATDAGSLDGKDSLAFVTYGGGSHSQLLAKNNDSVGWLRTTTNGIIADAPNTSSVGTPSWKFAEVHTLSAAGSAWSISATGAAIFNGTVQGTDAIATSDIRVKSDLTPILNATQKCKALRTTTHIRSDQGNRRSASVIAQDVEKVLPEAIHYSDDKALGKKLSVSAPAMNVLAIAAVNEHTDEISALKSKIDRLEALVKKLMENK
tara:strand:- start:24352 stop:29736 length:5385 start_codon:yes stop_codon:yes gene_type:complete